ncbi:MAG TPA: MarR family transcriptional regulator [Pseudonocardiaceae bacterium]
MDDGLSDLLHRVVSLLGEVARQHISSEGDLTYSRIRLLGALEDIEPATQHRLAQTLGVSDPAISRSLQPLEQEGLVRITTDPTHARRRLVELTDAGRKAYHASGKPLAERFRRALLAGGFPYDRYLADTLRLAEMLESARGA